MRRFTRLLLVSILALATFGGAVPAQGQTLPPSLQGEAFFVHTLQTGGTVDVSGDCTPAVGETFTLTYEAEGIATGPYPGTFRESGTATAVTTAGSFGFATGAVTSWEAQFEIDSPVGDVTGTKTFESGQTFALCADTGPLPERRDIQSVTATLSYDALIRPPTGGTFADAGSAFAGAQAFVCTPRPPCFFLDFESFQENFLVSTGVLPVDTSGKATGGGQIVSGSSPLDRTSFGFNVRKDEDSDRLKGTCNVLDHATGTHVKCLTVADYQQIVNTATWEGTAKVNGMTEDYRITVQDNGEPNQGIDTFSIKTETYEAAGNVLHGNVQLHKQQLVDAS